MNLWQKFDLNPVDAGKVGYIRALVARGYSANGGLTELKKSPLGGMRRQKFQRIFKAIKLGVLSDKYVQGLGKFDDINEMLLEESPYDHEKAYNYVIKATSRVSDTDMLVEQYVTVSTDAKLNKNTALLRAGMFLGREKYELVINETYAEVESVYLGTNYYDNQ